MPTARLLSPALALAALGCVVVACSSVDGNVEALPPPSLGGDASTDAPAADTSVAPSASTCTDQVANSAETDVDCGGGTCPTCSDSKKCADGVRDCTNGFCIAGFCQPPTCNDSVKDGAETAVDCGGGACKKCVATMGCADGARDCVSGVCTNGTCTAAACPDGVENGTETDADCGGGSCIKCAMGKKCVVGTRDCVSSVCTTNHCAAPACPDGFKNGSETDTDCGGGAPCTKCAVLQNCEDGLRDCVSGVCSAGKCVAPACVDTVKNGAETDVDCGGGAPCGPCVAGKICADGPRDCTSKICTGGTCQVPACPDGQTNGTETDLDCGGATCALKCATNKQCLLGSDCTSLVCHPIAKTCSAPGCNDGQTNGSETDVDCGGVGPCTPCVDGKVCVDGPRDCNSKVCAGGTCQAPACPDGQTNGSETDLDCGGATCALKCGTGQRCILASDCASLACDPIAKTCLAAGSYAASVIADSPVAYFRLGEAAGPTAANASAGGAAFNATYNGFAASQFSRAGLLAGDPNTAIMCDATPSYLSLPLSAEAASLKFPGAFTVEAWGALTSATGTRAIASTKGTGMDGYSFGVNGSGNLFLACHGKVNYGSTLTMPTDGTTHYMAAVFDGSTTVTFYLDNQSSSVTSAPIVNSFTTSTNLALCRFGDGQNFTWTGVLDEVALYNQALPLGRITAHRTAGGQ